MNDVLFSSKSEEWATPASVFNALDDEFHFTLDVCATPENAKCQRFFTKQDDGLSKGWDGETVFMNPPYGLHISKWIEKASQIRNGLVVCLVPARTDTRWFHEFIYGRHEIRFLKGRIRFNDHKNAAPFPSMVVVFRPLAP